VKKKSIQSRYFVTNHDTDEIYNKQLAHAYILTHEGYPTLLQRLREWLDKKKMNNLDLDNNQSDRNYINIIY
jgi:alpha-amylase